MAPPGKLGLKHTSHILRLWDISLCHIFYIIFFYNFCLIS